MRPKPRITKYIGLSTDTKPNADYGDTFREMDTGTVFMFDGETWHARSRERELSGDIVSFKALKVVPMQSVVVSMEPVQDLHGYDHPWPAGGGKNICDIDGYLAKSEAVYTKNGDEYTITTNIALYGNPFVFSDTDIKVTLSCASFANGTTTNARIDLLNSNGSVVGGLYADSASKFTIVTASKMRFNWSNGGVFSISKLQIESGMTATAYAPYSNICPISGRTGANVVVSPTTDAQDGTTYPISWQSEAGTVYGGTLDVVSGELVVDRAMVDMGTLEWHYMASNKLFFTNVFGKKPGITEGAVSQYANGDWWNEWADKDCVWCGNAANTGFVVKDTRFANVADFKSAMNGVQFCYYLAEPITYHLTPQKVRTLLGDNNVWSDAGDVTVKVKF